MPVEHLGGASGSSPSKLGLGRSETKIEELPEVRGPRSLPY